MRTCLTLFLLALPATAFAQDTTAGKKVYMANCMACHGMEADGKGPAAVSLKPPPSDFTSAEFWQTRTTDQVKATIRTGKPGTAMMPFAQLSDSDLDNLVAYLDDKRPG